MDGLLFVERFVEKLWRLMADRGLMRAACFHGLVFFFPTSSLHVVEKLW